jgi:NitT/TauT family transport system permease protein
VDPAAGVQATVPVAAPARPVRRLPVERDWPAVTKLAVQIGILIGIVALWEIGADTGYVDPFFWSQPSAIYRTLTIFFSTGDAFTDIGFTFRSTIFGFLLGTAAGSALGLSFWWSRNYAAIVQPYIICFESLPKLALAPLIVPVFGIGLASKVAIATALTLVVSTLTTYAGVKAVDPDDEKLFYSLGDNRSRIACVFSQTPILWRKQCERCAPPIMMSFMRASGARTPVTKPCLLKPPLKEGY